MNFRYGILFFIITLFSYLLVTRLACVDYIGDFHYYQNVVSFHLQELISNKSNGSIFVTRVFHNKLTASLFDVFYRYIQFFDIFYLINIVGLIGMFGLLFFYFYILKRKTENKIIKMFAIALLLLPFLEIFQLIKQTFLQKALYLILPYQIAAGIGWFFFLKRNKRFSYIICFFLLLVSVAWIIVFQNDTLNFCTR